MPRFFIDNTAVNGGYAIITGSDARHISLALRMRVGDGITLCDFSRNEYTCVIDSITPLEDKGKNKGPHGKFNRAAVQRASVSGAAQR